MVSEIDKKILNIQRSTKTQFLAFRFIHEWLKARFRPYYIWSVMPYSRIIHWAILLIYIASLPVFYGLYNAPSVNKTKAEGEPITYDFPRWEWQSPAPTGNGLNAIKPYGDDLWAVGWNGSIIQYSGSSWKQHYSGTDVTLRDIEVVDIRNIWAVGESGKILKYNGTSWTSQVSNTEENLYGIVAINTNNAWAVGANGIILHYNGVEWTEQESGTEQHLYSISAVDENNIFAVGASGTLLKFSDMSWSTIPTGTLVTFNDVDVYSEHAIWIAGSGGTIYRYNLVFDELIDFPIGTSNYDLNTVYALGDEQLITAGLDSGGGIANRIYRFDGAGWAYEETPNDNQIYAITIDNENNQWAVGDSGLMLKYIEGTWANQHSGIAGYYRSISIADSSHAWSVANSMSGSHILFYNGLTWESQYTGSNILDVFALDSNNAYAIGNGMFYKYEDGNWSTEECNNRLSELYALSEDDIFAAGSSGIIQRYNGVEWTSVDLGGVTNNLNAIHAFSAEDVWAVGDNIVLHYDGSEWENWSIEGVNFNDIHGGNSNDLWAVGDDGKSYRIVSGEFIDIVNTYSDDFASVMVLGSTIWATGSSGHIFKYLGGSWVRQAKIAVTLTELDGLDNSNLWVVGSGVLRYTSPANANATNLLIQAEGQEDFAESQTEFIGTPNTARVGVPYNAKVWSAEKYAVNPDKYRLSKIPYRVQLRSSDPGSPNSAEFNLNHNINATCNDEEARDLVTQYCGTYTTTYTFHTPGTWTISANDAGGSGLVRGESPPVTVLAGLPSDFTFAKAGDYGSNPKPGQSRPLTLNLKDLYGNVADNTDGASVTFSGPDHGRFSTSPTGPWSESLTTTVPAGTTSLILYYIDYQMGTSTITASAFSKQKTLDIAIDQGDIDPAASHTTISASSLSAGQTATIFTNLVDVNGKKVAGKTVKYYSSRNGDNVTQPSSATDGNGDTLGFISSYKGGDLNISTLDETDGVWLLDRPKLTFVALPVKEDVPETAITASPVVTPKPKEENNLINDLRNNPIAKKLANVLNPFVAATAALGLVPLIASIVGSAPAALHGLTYGVSLTMEAIGIRKRRKTWGKVYDSTTGKGVDLALVRLYDQHNMKLIGTIVTDLKGQYTFQPQPGTYAISVAKDNYLYPTQIFARYGISKIDKDASRINSHYLGQPINITDKDDHLNLDIPIDPINKKPTFFRKLKIWSEDTSYLITFGLSFLFMPTLIIGTLLASFVSIVLPGTRNMIVAIVYLLITLVYTLSRMIKSHQHGTVVDEEGTPLSNVMISIFDKAHNTLKESRITDRFGRYSIFAEPGQYLLKAEAQNYEFNPDKLKDEIRKSKDKDKFTGQTINLKKEGYINFTIIGRKK